ncbi:MAG: hypothetical protein ACFNS8_05390 [Kingella oralis]
MGRGCFLGDGMVVRLAKWVFRQPESMFTRLSAAKTITIRQPEN